MKTNLFAHDRIAVVAFPYQIHRYKNKIQSTSNVKMPCLKYCRGGNKQFRPRKWLFLPRSVQNRTWKGYTGTIMNRYIYTYII